MSRSYGFCWAGMLIASQIISTTGEGTVVDALLGMVGAVVGGWLSAKVIGSKV